MIAATYPNPTRQPVPLPTLHERSLLAIIIRLWPCNGAPGIIYLTPSLPHDISREDFYANQQPAAECARRVPVVSLCAPSFPRAGVFFAPRSIAAHRLHTHLVACCAALDRHLLRVSLAH